MERKIVAFHQDSVGDWVADFNCGHTRHVRHNPPLVEHAWVTCEEGRSQHIGEILDCVDCDRTEDHETPLEKLRRQVAAAVKFECLKAALDGYESAKASGLCHEGAWEVAIDRLKAVETEAILERLPD